MLLQAATPKIQSATEDWDRAIIMIVVVLVPGSVSCCCWLRFRALKTELKEKDCDALTQWHLAVSSPIGWPCCSFSALSGMGRTPHSEVMFKSLSVIQSHGDSVWTVLKTSVWWNRNSSCADGLGIRTFVVICCSIHSISFTCHLIT